MTTLAPLAAIDWTAILARKAKPPESWTFDTDRQRWQHGESGRPVPPARIAQVLAERQASVKESLSVHGAALANGTMTPAEFQAAARQAVKDAHIQARLLAIGGRENATPKDWGHVGADLKKQYGFLSEMAATPNMSEAYAGNRAAMYGGSAVGNSYAKGQRDSHAAAGFDQKWREGPDDDHTCETCRDEIAAGRVPIDEPGWEIGHTDCMANDRCGIMYGRSGDEG